MPKAPQEIVDRLDNNEDVQEFTLLPEDAYLCYLHEVTEYDQDKDHEYGGVRCFWKVIQPREFKGERVLNTLSWSPKAAWKVRETFDACGYEYNSDLDELVENEERAIVVVTQEIARFGKRKGQTVNKVDEILEATPEAIAALPA